MKPDNSKSLYRITNTLPSNIRNIVLPDCDDIVLLAKKFQFYFSSKVEDSLGKLQKIVNLTRSPGDGHCLFYSTVTSWNSQYHNHANINKPWLMQAIESEIKENLSKYIGFLSYLNPAEISEQWDLYLWYTYNLCKLINVHPDSADQHDILIVHRYDLL